jgi:serine/threonine-protein kinase
MDSAVLPTPTGTPADRLDSWKEIAAYLNRGVTTVQRWERDEGLPVHRQQHDALGSVYAFRHELEAWRMERAARAEAEERSASAAAPSTVRFSRQRLQKLLLAGAALVGAVALGAIVQRLATRDPQESLKRLTIVPPGSAPMVLNGSDRSLAITPDGSRIVYVGGPGGSRLFVRALDQVDATPIAGVGSPRHPFISPDGNWIGFFDRSTLKKVPLNGGLPTILARGDSAAREVAFGSEHPKLSGSGRLGPRGATWGPDNHITFALDGRLLRIAASGGEPEILASPDPSKGEAAYSWPEYLPGGVGLLFTILPAGDWSETGSRSSVERAQVAVLDLRTRTKKVLLEGGSHARYVESGHLIYAANGAIKAMPFDLRRLTTSGTAKTVIPQVATTTRGAANFDVAHDGTLIYATGSMDNDLVSLTWVDRAGHEQPLGTPEFVYQHPRLSPDGSQLALDTPRDLGIWDFASRTFSWLGVGPTSHVVWTPDGRQLIFSSTRGGPARLYSQSVDGARPAAQMASLAKIDQFPNAVTPDGRQLVIRQDGATPDLMVMDLAGARAIRPLIQTSSRELNADISPDGRFMIYQSNISGQDEVYIQPFPDLGAERWTISTGGGKQPKWAPNGREIFYVSPTDAMMSVAIQQRGIGFATGAPTKLFEGQYYFGDISKSGRTYDVSPRDGRFLMMKYAGDTEPVRSADIEVVLNWFDELKRTVLTTPAR